MNQILPDAVVLSVPALTVQQLLAIHPRKKCKHLLERCTATANSGTGQIMNELYYVNTSLMKIGEVEGEYK